MSSEEQAVRHRRRTYVVAFGNDIPGVKLERTVTALDDKAILNHARRFAAKNGWHVLTVTELDGRGTT